MQSNSIKNWSEDERPREKMQMKGPASLSDAELLAILISSGTKEKSALDLARDILALAHNNLHELGRLGILELQKTKGIGEARAISTAAWARTAFTSPTTGNSQRRPIWACSTSSAQS